jgi:hypothetical protein
VVDAFGLGLMELIGAGCLVVRGALDSVWSSKSFVFVMMICLGSSCFLLGLKIAEPSLLRDPENPETGLEPASLTYSFADVAWIVGLTAVASGSLVGLLHFMGHGPGTISPSIPGMCQGEASGNLPAANTGGSDRKRWEGTLIQLAGNEEKVYRALLASEGMALQTEIARKVSLPRATVSTALKRLEGRGLVKRKRTGMTNIVALE